VWPSERDKYIKKLTDGNERIIATEIQTNNKTICLINVYLPTKMTNSDNQYQENIDILQTMIDK
jgi:exonuclease III